MNAKNLVFGVWLLKLAFERLPNISYLPADLFEPVGLLMFLPDAMKQGMMNYWFLMGLCVSGGILACLAMFGKRNLLVLLLAAACYTVYAAVIRGFGHMNHSDIPILLAVYAIFAVELGNWFDKQQAAEWVETFAVLAVLCTTYSLMGVSRLYLGGLEVFTTDSMTTWVVFNAHFEGYFSLGIGEFTVEQPLLRWALNMGLPVITFFELLSPLCLCYRRFSWAFLLVMIPFHIFVFLTMEILFWENLLMLGLIPLLWRQMPKPQ